MSKELEALKVWNAVEKYLNLYHHQAIKDDINVKTVEGMPIKIIEKSLKALEIIKKYFRPFECEDDIFRYCLEDTQYVSSRSCKLMSKEEFDLLKEVLE